MIVSKGRLSSLLRSRRSSGAKDAGFQATRFNALVDTNTAAVRPWESLGSPTIDTVPQAFDSATRVGPAACQGPAPGTRSPYHAAHTPDGRPASRQPYWQTRRFDLNVCTCLRSDGAAPTETGSSDLRV